MVAAAVALWIAFAASFILAMKIAEKERFVQGIPQGLLSPSRMLASGALALLSPPLLLAAVVVSLFAFPVPVALWIAFAVSFGLGMMFGKRHIEGVVMNWLSILFLISAIAVSFRACL